ncbi:hypothetical protein [Companilactobacillus hulinensis]|uniref:hypothetical protein n=1 Tax=Companilactobacillus hulinensis TaxID=2486007 RepID=UPI000F76A8E0|nr:hypothetical protein [Companilactobacillus hulinensis]
MIRILIGIAVMFLGIFQIYSSRNAFVNLKTNGNKSTSPFMLYALFFSFFIGFVFIVIGFAVAFNLLGMTV